MDLEIGKTYTDSKKNTRKITDISKDGRVVYYVKNNRPIVQSASVASFRLYAEMGKPLDQAFKELDKKLCSHRNIREDRFFSAMVYKTCKDCGQALN
jgi:hypothetical protein